VGQRSPRHVGFGVPRRGAKVGEAAIALLERRARRCERFERPLMRCDAIAIELRQRGSGTCRLPETAHVGRGKKQPRVPGLSELVHLDEPGFEIRARRDDVGLQLRELRSGFGQLALDLCGLHVQLPKFFRLDLPLELELAQIAKQGSFLRRELIGFAMQGLHAIARPRGERLSACTIVLPRGNSDRERHHDQSADR
jgi:hypothetical protein